MNTCPRCTSEPAHDAGLVVSACIEHVSHVGLCPECFHQAMQAKYGEISTDNTWATPNHWQAHFDDYEPGCPVGEGATEDEAIADLLDQVEAKQSMHVPAPPKVDLPPSVYRMPPGECKFCDDHRNEYMMPSHTPSHYCESGKRPHCTCDTCF